MSLGFAFCFFFLVWLLYMRCCRSLCLVPAILCFKVSELRSNNLMFCLYKQKIILSRRAHSMFTDAIASDLFSLFCELGTSARFRFNRFPIEFRVVGELWREKEPPNPFRVPECFYFTLWTHWILAVTFFSVTFIVQAVKRKPVS